MSGIVISTTLFTVYFPSKREYKSHDSIIILNDQDFTNYRFPGSGEMNDPYIIEGLYINSSLEAIRIEGTTKYFVIRNCKLESNERAVYINSAAQGTVCIRDNIFVEGSISVTSSNKAVIENNMMIEGSSHGIRLEGSVLSVIRNNTIYNNEFAVFLVDANYIIIEENYIYSDQIIGHDVGVYDFGNIGIFSQGTNNIIRNNTILRQNLGLYQYGGNSSVTNNLIRECLEGIYARYIGTSNITNNMIINNTAIGIHVFRTGYANINHNYFEGNNISLQISESYFNDIQNNTFFLNLIGLEIKVDCPAAISYINSYNNTVRFNLFQNNTFYGVKNGWLCKYSKIYLNSFYFNNLSGTSQAYDEGSYSEWSNIYASGNFWSEWSLGDYVIDGNSNSTDSFPLLNPPV
ncbi:MAG: hypothetical protein GPJ50_13660 [Candidatus Heimdallarchaeota archaeon]|nr:hypothetical protein [Candidatus Heimdallarchaeota archaeon]MCG3254731.1 right-handed parallel beta-helix repeat-containing protein [Candidatus Heimdallarchaeota archaeon]